jgi:hypothetical protein
VIYEEVLLEEGVPADAIDLFDDQHLPNGYFEAFGYNRVLREDNLPLYSFFELE